MKSKVNNNLKRICVISSTIPPEYSGAGKRAYRHCLYLQERNMLWGLVNQTREIYKGASDQQRLPESVIYRFNKNQISNKPIQKIIGIIKYNLDVFYFLARNRKEFNIIHSFGSSWDELGINLFSKIFNKPLLREFTLYPDFKKATSHWSQKSILKHNLNCADRVICVSKALQDWALKHKIRSKTMVIENDTMFQPPKLSKRELRKNFIHEDYLNKTPVVLFVGPKSFRKGFDIAYKTFSLLLKEFPDSLMLLLGISGKNVTINQEFYDIDALKKRGNILDLGLVDNTEPYFQLADVLLFPSRREGMPNVVLEAMATGTAVVARKIEGITDSLILNGVDGFLVDDGDDPNAYLLKIRQLVGDPNTIQTIGQKSVKKIKKKYSPEKIFNKYLELYNNTLEPIK